MRKDRHFQFVNDTAVRIKGTRVGIEKIVIDFKAGKSPEEMALRFPTVSLEQVYATIAYYLANTEPVERYMQLVKKQQLEGWEQQQSQPSEFVQSLRKRLAQQRQSMPMHDEATILVG